MGIFEMSHATKKRLHLNPGLSEGVKTLSERQFERRMEENPRLSKSEITSAASMRSWEREKAVKEKMSKHDEYIDTFEQRKFATRKLSEIEHKGRWVTD